MRIKRFKDIGFIIILVSLCLTPIIWFIGRGAVLIDGVDTNFPLNPIIWILRRLYVWNSISNAGLDFSSSTAGLLFHFIQVLPFVLTRNLQITEIFSLVFWSTAIILSAFYLARSIFPQKHAVQILFVVLYSFNIYLFNSWENVKVANLSLIASIPFALAVLIKLKKQQISLKRSLLYFSLVGLLLSGTGINPAYFICFFLILFLYTVVGLINESTASSAVVGLRNFFIASFIIFLINSFWILPTVHFVETNLTASSSIYKLGFTNWVDSLSQNTSLLNVFRLQGLWDWYAIDQATGQPVYIPYSINYFNNPIFIAISFSLPFLAILSLILYQKKLSYLYEAFGLMFLIGVFFGAGTHDPTGNWFRLLSDHLPFFTLFRSPWYIFTPLTILSVTGLICLLFDHLYSIEIGSFKFSRSMVSGLVILLVIGNLFYCYPQITGKIFRPEKQPNFYIHFPSYIFDTKNWLDQIGTARIFSYPDDGIENFSWGYAGTESILGLLTNNEVISTSLNNTNSSISNLISDFYLALKKGQLVEINRLSEKLSIGWIFEKKDQSTLADALPQQIKSMPTKTFGMWNFYQYNPNVTPKIYLSTNAFDYKQFIDYGSTLGILDKDQILVNQADNEINRNQDIGYLSSDLIEADNSQLDYYHSSTSGTALANNLKLYDINNVDFNFHLSRDGSYQPILERYRLEDFGINLNGNLKVQLDGREAVISINKIDDSYVYFDPIYLTIGDHQLTLTVNNQSQIDGIQQPNQTIELSNINGSGNLKSEYKINNFDHYALYYIRLKYHQIYGNNGAVVIIQNTKSTLVDSETKILPNYPDWVDFNFYYKPVETQSDLSISLLAPYIKDPFGTKVFYSNLQVNKIFSNNLFLVGKPIIGDLNKPTVSFTKISPVEYDGEMSNINNPFFLVFSENFSQDWQLSIYDVAGKPITSKLPHFTTNLYANGWFVDKYSGNFKFKIYYNSQRLFKIGSAISISVFILIFFIFKFKNNEK